MQVYLAFRDSLYETRIHSIVHGIMGVMLNMYSYESYESINYIKGMTT